MPSREIRRTKRQKGDSEKKPSEEKKKSNSLLYVFSFIILVIIVVTFVGTPVAGRLGSQQSVIFGSYADKEIQFRPGNYLSRQKDILGEQIRQSSSSDDIVGQAYQVWREAFQRTVVHVGILHEVEKSGLSVTDDLIDKSLAQYGPYVQNGQFSEELYNATPNQEKYVTRQLYRENLKEEQFREDFFERQYDSNAEKEFLKTMSTPERRFKFILYTFDEYPLEEVIAYGEENSYLFQQIQLSRIAIKSSEKEAETILEQLRNEQAGFENLAQTQSVDSYAEKGGEMGWQTYFEMQGDFPDEEALQEVFNLEPGEVSSLIEYNDMWFIYRCDEAVQQPDFTDEEVRQQVRRYMERFEAGKIEDYFVTMANEFRETALTTTFDQASTIHDRTTRLTDFFPINHGNVFFLKQVTTIGEASLLNSASYNEEFFIQAFSLSTGDISEPIVLDKKIVLLQFEEQREAPEQQVEQIDTYFQFIVQQYRDQDLRNYFLNSDKLENNFNQTFYKYFMPQKEG